MAKPLTPDQLVVLRSVPVIELPNRVRIALALANASQAEVIEETKIPQANLSRIVNGRVGASVENARKLAEFFGCAIEDLFPAREAVAS